MHCIFKQINGALVEQKKMVYIIQYFEGIVVFFVKADGRQNVCTSVFQTITVIYGMRCNNNKNVALKKIKKVQRFHGIFDH